MAKENCSLKLQEFIDAHDEEITALYEQLGIVRTNETDKAIIQIAEQLHYSRQFQMTKAQFQ